MFEILKILSKKPSDTQLKYGRIIFGILLIAIGCVAFYVQNLSLQDTIMIRPLSENIKMNLSYIIIGFGILPVLSWAFELHILTSWRAKILQIIFGIFLIYLGTLFQETAALGINILYIFLGIFVMIWGALGKFITEKGRKYGQKVTKIRV